MRKVGALIIASMTIVSLYLIYKNIVYQPIKYQIETILPIQKKQVFLALRDFDQVKNWKKNLYQREPSNKNKLTNLVWESGLSYKESLLIEDRIIEYLVHVLDYREFSTIKFTYQKDNAFKKKILYRLSQQPSGTLLQVNYLVEFDHFLAKATSSAFLEQTLKEGWEEEINTLRFYLVEKISD